MNQNMWNCALKNLLIHGRSTVQTTMSALSGIWSWGAGNVLRWCNGESRESPQIRDKTPVFGMIPCSSSSFKFQVSFTVCIKIYIKTLWNVLLCSGNLHKMIICNLVKYGVEYLSCNSLCDNRSQVTTGHNRCHSQNLWSAVY